MEFSRLRVRGFKSFCDEVELPINDGLTGIVGPNGCGKSNVVEALRWVMGESSARDLRGSEMDDVLFGGSALRPAFDVAEVSLAVTNAVSGTPVSPEHDNVFGLAEARAQHWGTDLEITRKIERGSGSSYRINSRDVRARDIQLIFADAAAGSRSPAIISQGRVNAIIEAKPEERRRFLEDAAGIGGLHSRRREAELKLNATQANLARVKDRLADLEQDLAGLQRQAREAERYRKLSEEIRHFDQLLLLARVVDAEGELDKQQRLVQGAGAKTLQRNQELDEAACELAGIVSALPGVGEEITKLTARIAAGKERLGRLSELAATHNREIIRIDQAIAEAKSDVERLNGLVEERSQTLPQLRSALAEAESQREHTASQAPKLRGLANELAQLEPQARQRWQASLESLATNRAELGATRQAVDGLRKRHAEIEAELARAKEVDDDALVRVAERQVNEAKARFADSMEQHGSAQSDLDLIRAGIQEHRQKAEDLRAHSARAASRWQELENERLRIEALLNAFSQKEKDLHQRSERVKREAERLEQEIAGLGLDDLAQQRRQASGQAALFEGQLKASREVKTQAQANLAEISSRLNLARRAFETCRDTLVALQTEASALSAVSEDADPNPVLTGLVIDPGFEAALSAGLGDDLLFGKSPDRARYWQEIEAGMLPAWPRALDTMDRHVKGEPALMLRLALIGICESAEEAAILQHSLSPGQRLVTRDGGLWRWDGLVHQPGASQSTSERIRQRRRQAELEKLIPKQTEALGACEADLAAVDAAHAASSLSFEESKRNTSTLEHQVDEAKREDARLRERLEDQHTRLEQLRQDRGRIGGELAQIEREMASLARPDGIDPIELAGRLDDARNSKAGVAHQLQFELENLSQCEKRERLGRDRLASIGNTVDNARQAVTQAESLFERRQGEAEGRRQSRGQAIDGLNRDLQTVQQAIEDTALKLARLENEQSGLIAQQDELAAAHRKIESDLQSARHELGQNESLMARLDDRITALCSDCERVEHELTVATSDLELANLRAEKALGEKAEFTRDAAAGQNAAQEAKTLAHRIGADEHGLSELQTQLHALEHARDINTRRKESAAEAAIQAREQLAAAKSQLHHAEAQLNEHARAAERGISEPPAKLLANEQIRDALTKSSASQIEVQLNGLKAKRERMGAVNLRAAIEIEDRESAFNQLGSEEADLSEAIERLNSAIQELDREARKRLVAAFDKVDGHFRRLFTQLFGGGKAHLRLTNIDVPGKAGLELDAMPPGKKLQNISLLSGGEKGLTALALVFALFLSQPSPLCVLDEVDAALDDANVERFVDLMAEIARQTDTRFVVVTHHPLTMARMDRLFGVTMIERGVSRLVSVTLSTAIEFRSTA